MSNTLNWDESEHPRDEIGEFTEKDGPGLEAPPPRQQLMFDDNPTGRLFDAALFESSKKAKKKPAEKAGPSLVEQIEDDLKKQHDANKPLGGQKEMFSRRFDGAVIKNWRNRKLRETISAAARRTDLSPSDEQKAAGNYRKGKFNWRGLTIAIENPSGSVRSGKSKAGTAWSIEMKHHYGYILRNISEADGDHVDVFIGQHPESDVVFVVDQRRPSGRFDEHKALIGFTSLKDAKRAYFDSYSAGWDGLESITPMTVHQFRNWLKQGDTGTRIADQVSKYAKKPSERGHWVTIRGAHVFVAGDQIVKGPANLTKADPSKPSAVESPKHAGQWGTDAPDKERIDPREYRPWSTDVEVPGDIHFDEWVNEDEPQSPPPKGKSRKAAIMESAGVPVEDVMLLMPTAQKHLKQEQREREQAKAHLRRVSGLNAGSLARMENKYVDHSMVKNWDTTAREFAMDHPVLGFDPDGHDTPAMVWDFLREGKAEYISAYHPQVAALAAEWAKPHGRQAGDEDDQFEPVSARDDESVPFSRRRNSLRLRFARIFDRMLLRYSAWREADHPRGQPENSGEFVKSGSPGKPKPMLTKNQFIAQKQRDGVDRAEASKQYAAYRQAYRQEHGTSVKPEGDELRVQQEKSLAGQVASRKRQSRMEQRIDSFADDLPMIHERLISSGFSLAKQSASGSRYYERNGEWVRVSDHAPNEATQRWMDSVGCADVSSLNELTSVADC